MNRRLAAIALFAQALVATSAHAVFSVTEPWVRTASDGRNADVFMKLRSTDEVSIVSVDSFAAKSVTLHTGSSTRPAQSMVLPANQVVELKPQEAHIRLAGLVRRLKMGEHVPLTLIVRGANAQDQKIFVNAEVRRRSPTEDELDPKGHVHGPGAHRH
jgi:copper(I)-binding protein